MTTAILGLTFFVGRVLYAVGYCTGDPAMRTKKGGFIYAIGYLGCFIIAMKLAVRSAWPLAQDLIGA